MDKLQEIRKSLEACDSEIEDALIRRMQCAAELVRYKMQHGLELFSPDEATDHRNIPDGGSSGHPYGTEIEDVFSNITENSRKIQAKILFPKNIILIGFMGAGKSSAASCLAQRFAMQVIETDQEIVKREGMPIPEIFNTHGETYFRDRETEVFRDVKEGHQMIISAGGGAVLRDENVKYMKTSGSIVLLTASPAAILERVRDSRERPLLNGNMNEEYISGMMEKRRARYEEVADHIIDTTGKTVPEVCEAIIRALHEGEQEASKSPV